MTPRAWGLLSVVVLFVVAAVGGETRLPPIAEDPQI